MEKNDILEHVLLEDEETPKKSIFHSAYESDSNSLDVKESDVDEESDAVAFDDEVVEIKDNHNSKSNNVSKKDNIPSQMINQAKITIFQSRMIK